MVRDGQTGSWMGKGGEKGKEREMGKGLFNVKEILGEVENQSKVEIDKLRKFRAEINTYLDRREKELLDNIEKVKTEDENALTALKTDCELMKTRLEAIKTELTSGDVSVNQRYVTARRGMKELRGINDNMEKMTDRMNARKYQFTKDADTERLLGSKMGLGTLDVAGEFRKNISLDSKKDSVAQGTTVKTGAKSKIRYSDGVIRRTNWVGNVLEDTILQIFANGEMDVWWEASGVQEKDKQTQQLLETQAGKLRHLLLQSQVCGRVPPVVFMRDISIARKKQIEELLHNLDTGPPDTELELEEDKLELQVDWKRKQAWKSNGHSSDLVVKPGETDVERIEFEDKSLDSHEVDSNICEDVSYSFDQELSVEEKGVEGNDSKRVRTSDFKFRQDLYGLQHDSLMKKVLDSKLAKRPLAAVEEKETFNMDRLVFKQDKKRAYKPFKVSKRILERLERQTYGYNNYDD
ncbi:RBFA-like protein [Mya arenaria]|uniref:RBFA-like protein n=1 Tax=Mya arenaria TaxID=6604 RepID=A0ABY7ETT0_MYAAR|nr:RBFA-like protein [Mya arenaria]